MLCGVMTKLNQVQKSANELAVPASRHMCNSADKEDGDRHVMWRNDQGEQMTWQFPLNELSVPCVTARHMCNSADKEDGDRHVMWSNDQADPS